MIGTLQCNTHRQSDSIKIILKDQNITDIQLQQTLQSCASRIRTLWLTKNNITFKAIRCLQSIQLIWLKQLSLGNNKVGDKGCKHFTSLSLPQLQMLELRSNNISSIGMAHISKADWKQLQMLYLDGNSINAKGLKALTKMNSCLMKRIWLTNNTFGVQNTLCLAVCSWDNLQYINFYNSKYSNAIERIKPVFEARYGNINMAFKNI